MNGTVFPLHFETFNVKKNWEVAENEEIQALIPLISDDLNDYYTLVCESSEDEIECLQSCLARVDGYVLIHNLKPGKYDHMCCMFEIGMEHCTRFESAFIMLPR